MQAHLCLISFPCEPQQGIGGYPVPSLDENFLAIYLEDLSLDLLIKSIGGLSYAESY